MAHLGIIRWRVPKLGSLGEVRDSRLLFIQHADDCPPGWFGEWLSDSGVGYDVIHGGRGDEIPAELGKYAGLVVLGGDMGANDDADNPWLTPTKALIASVVRSGGCFLGICLGHQLAAAALGGEVIRNPLGEAAGLTPVALTTAGRSDPLLGIVADGARAVQWNRDIVSRLPVGANLLATAPDGTAQAARYGDFAWGVQFHPETSPAVFNSWTVANPSADVPPRYDLAGIASAIAAAEPELRSTWAPMADRFAALAQQRLPVP
jgi:GMP synthase (glutamine-hydrolysing)